MPARAIARYAAVMAAAALLLGASSGAAGRRVLVVNQGNEAIFALRIGHLDGARWSGDLLAFDQVIDVSRGSDVSVDIDPAACVYDVQATYGDGDTQALRDIDLCRIDRLSFDH